MPNYILLKFGVKLHFVILEALLQFQIEMTEEEIDSHPQLYEMLNRHHCCPTSDGSGAAVLMSEAAVKKYGLEHQAVEILAQAMTSEMPNVLGHGRLECGESGPKNSRI